MANSKSRYKHDRWTIHEVHRERPEPKRGVRPPIVEKFHGLDRARLAALGYALDGAKNAGNEEELFTGLVAIYRVMLQGERELSRDLVDVFDERVAFRVLNDLVLPRPGQLSVSVERLQDEVNRMAALGL